MSQPYPSRRPSESTMAAYHTETPSHRTRRPSESTMAAYHTETPSHRTRQPSESAMAAYHARTPPYGQHGPHLTPHPPVKPRGQQTKTRWPITTRKAPSQKKATLNASHGRVPETANT